VSLPAAQAVAWVGWLPAAWLVRVADVGASVPGAALPWPDGMRGALLLAVLTAVVWPALTRRRYRRVLAAGLASASVTAAGLAVARPAWPPPGWFAVFCDVGQGDAVVLKAEQGSAVVVDAGPDPVAMDRCLDRLGVDRVPLVVLSHLHADHVDGLPGVLDGRSVGLVQVGPLQEPDERAEAVQRWTAAAGVPVELPALGESRSAGDLRWTVLAPARRFTGTTSDPNNSSLVLRVQAGPTTLLLTGDIEPEAQRDLVRRGVELRADVLKVPHHGSRHQDPEFLRAVGAAVVVTSVGADNDYGHPAQEVLDALQSGGARSFRTDLDGDVALAHRGGRLVVVGRSGSGEPGGGERSGGERSGGERSGGERPGGEPSGGEPSDGLAAGGRPVAPRTAELGPDPP
jgi:competence protein ComEC